MLLDSPLRSQDLDAHDSMMSLMFCSSLLFATRSRHIFHLIVHLRR